MLIVVENSDRHCVTRKSAVGRFAELYKKADAAGKAAADACCPTPMVVGSPTNLLSNDLDPDKAQYFVPDGVHGFAWVTFKGNTAFGKWAKKNGIARNGYPSGLQIWISDYGQSMQLKQAYACAFARILNEAGIDAWSDSRMD